MKKHFGEYIKERVFNQKSAIRYGFEGCNQDEIEVVMHSQGVTFLPRIFREYLETMGKSGGAILFAGSHASYGSMLYKKKFLQSELSDVRSKYIWNYFTLPEDAFVFMDHQGCEYYYFLTADQNDDPTIYACVEETDNPLVLSESMSDFFEEYIIQLIDGYVARKAYRQNKHEYINNQQKKKGTEALTMQDKSLIQHIIQNIKSWFV